MKCLLKYQWVKLPRELLLSHRKGIMGKPRLPMKVCSALKDTLYRKLPCVRPS